MAVRILTGDCRHLLPTLPADSFDCCVTSPPYFGLRDYGVEGQIGLEPTLDAYVETMVGVFREVRRVMKPEGTCWLNLGDSYAATSRSAGASMKSTLATKPAAAKTAAQREQGSWKTDLSGLKPKDLCGVPWRVAFALQEQGWWLRSEIIWAKPNPMPESVTDRPTCAHEKVFLLTKSHKYYYDAKAIAEQGITGDIRRPYGSQGAWELDGRPQEQRSNGKPRKTDKPRGHSRRHAGFNDRWDAMSKEEQCSGTRNARNVWTIAPQPFKGAHFATMPPALVERCVKAGCPAGGHVLDPFGGAGTTGLVADRIGRNATLIELNESYRDMAIERLKSESPLFSDIA